MLAALAGTLSYASYLVIGTVAEHLAVGHGTAGLLLAALFTRLPWVRNGKLRTVGLLPARARRPVMFALLALSLFDSVYRADLVAVGFIGLAAIFLMTFRWMRHRVFNRVMSPFSRPSVEPTQAARVDDKVIDVVFRERKD